LEVGARILNPLEAVTAPGAERLGTTAYFADTLLVAAQEAGLLGEFVDDESLRARGWRVVPDETFASVQARGEEGILGVVRWRVEPLPDAVVAAPVDAHVVVQLLRSRGVTRVGLEHVYVSHVRGHTSGHTDDADEHLETGRYRSSGGRLPVAYAGRPPARQATVDYPRPVVGVLDSGCGEHEWLVDGVRRDVPYVDTSGVAHPIGLGGTPEPPDPEQWDKGGDFVGPIDGVIDPFSGHGTFVCGLVRQTCPNADILSWRIVPSTGLIREGDLINALAGIVNLVRQGTALDVLNLSLGHYHELNDRDAALVDRVKQVAAHDPAVVGLLQALSALGVAVVCSAGNDATARPMFPAAYSVLPEGWPVPITAVGSLNPNGVTVSIRSNTGPWVTAYRPGTQVFSTLPAFQGGYEPVNRTRAFGWTRESVDPDDFRRRDAAGGFALWSGTSFAAPVQAGLIAAAIEQRAQTSGAEEIAQIVRRLAEESIASGGC